MISKLITIEGDYLHIPIKIGARRNELQLWVGSVLQYQFAVELEDVGPYEYYFMNVSAYKGSVMKLMIQSPNEISDTALENVFIGEAPEKTGKYPKLYQEELRPQFHFSSRRGWLNDPNGLYYHNGVYHLYYQHDPFGTIHRSVNISWGHATSTDLMQWQEHPDAILPWNREWLVASGSAIVDREGVAGFGKDAVIAAFTCLGAAGPQGEIAPSGGQFLAASVDEGMSFYRFSHLPSIPVPNGEDWRDPRIFEAEGRYYIAVYERHHSTDGVTFYESYNLREWKKIKWIENLYECPDLFPLTIEETGEEKWLLYGADAVARLGSFKNGYFIDKGIHFPLDYGESTYAGQTWNHEPKNRCVHISWIRGMDDATVWEQDMGYHNMPFSQCMSIPCEISLHQVGENYFLCRYPVEETNKLRGKILEESFFSSEGNLELPLHPQSDSVLCINDTSGKVLFYIGKHELKIDCDKQTISVDGKKPAVLMDKEFEIRILTDRTSVELFINKQIAVTFGMCTKGGTIRFSNGVAGMWKVWKMKSCVKGN